MLEGFQGSSHVLAHIAVPGARSAIPIDLEYKWIGGSIPCEGCEGVLLRSVVPWLPFPLLRTILWQIAASTCVRSSNCKDISTHSAVDIHHIAGKPESPIKS